MRTKCFAFMVCLIFATHMAAAGQVVLRCGTGEPLEESPIGMMLVKFKEAVESASAGEIEVRLFPSLQLGGLREMLEATRLGNQEMVVCTPAWGSAFIPQLSVLSFPFLFENDEKAFALLDGEVGAELSAYAEKAGFVILGYPCFGYRQITNSVRPIRSIEDLAGIKLRLQSDPVHIAAMKELGANPVAMNPAELYSALQQRVVDGQENSTTSTYLNKWHEVQNYLSLTNIFYDSWAIFMNKAFHDRLSESHRRIITAAAADAVAFQRTLVIERNQQYLELLGESLEVNEVSQKELDRMAERARIVYTQFNDRIGEDLVKKVLEATE